MTLLKSAQEALFKEIAEAEFSYFRIPKFNGYSKEDIIQFEKRLNTLYEKFESEINDNLTNRSPSLEIYLTDIHKTISDILDFQSKKKTEELYHILKENKSFKDHELGILGFYLKIQLKIIKKTEAEIRKKLKLVKDPKLIKLDIPSAVKLDNSPILKNKIKSKLSRINLTVLLWWLAEAEMLYFEDNHGHFVKFIENNVQFYKDGQYVDMKNIGSLMAKLNDKDSNEAIPETAQKQLWKLLEKTTLPPMKSVLEKNKWKK